MTPWSVRLMITHERSVSDLLTEGEARIDGMVRSILRSMNADGDGGLPAGFDVAAAYDLYRALLGERQAILAGKKHLIVVAHGSLTALPFQLLVKRMPAPGASLREAAWLVRDHAVSVLPSVSSLWALRKVAEIRSGTAPLPFVGFGDPVIGDWSDRTLACRDGQFQTALVRAPRSPDSARARLRDATSAGAKIADTDWIRAQPALPESGCELRTLAQAEGEGSVIFVGADATEARVKRMSDSGELEGYRILAFATHGLLPQEAEGSSEAGLILTPPQQGDAMDDGLLTASEVAGLRLNADWVILSACNTAAGDAPGSETLSGLARAFFFAGARGVLVSHWSVYSEAAVLITTRALEAYENDPSMSKAESLRRAELSFLDPSQPEVFAHPRFWAPFSLIGDGHFSVGEFLYRTERKAKKAN
jgi:CHAT domain-containing protein